MVPGKVSRALSCLKAEASWCRFRGLEWDHFPPFQNSPPLMTSFHHNCRKLSTRKFQLSLWFAVFPGGLNKGVQQDTSNFWGGSTHAYGPVDQSCPCKTFGTKKSVQSTNLFSNKKGHFFYALKTGSPHKMEVRCLPFPPIVSIFITAKISTLADTGFDSFPASEDICTYFSKRKDTEPNKCKV